MLSDSRTLSAVSTGYSEETDSHAGSPLLRLRPHHFLCIQNYRGHGYSPAFDEKMKSVIASLRRPSGAWIRIVHCDSAAPERFDALVLAHAGFKEGDTIVWKLPGGQDPPSADDESYDQIRTDPYGIPIMCRALLDACCPGCSWRDLCTEIDLACL